MSGRRILAAVAAALTLAAGAVALAGIGTVDPGYPTYEVTRGRFLHRVEADGGLAAEQATVLTTPRAVQGPMKIAWLKADGTEVAEGEVVVRFDATDMEKELFNGEADRAKAETQSRQKELEQQATLENLDRDADLAAMQLEHAEEFQADDAEIFSRNELIESQIDGALATRRQSHAEKMREIREDLGGVELDLLQLDKRQAQLTIEKAEAGLRELELRAPHAGIFVLRRDWGEAPTIGQMAWPGMALGEIPQLDAMRAQVWVLEADAGGLEPGMTAEVVLEAHPGVVVPGKVRRVSAVATRRARWSPVQYFEVDLELAYTDPDKMKPGQRVHATILLQDLEEVFAIPREAVFRDESDRTIVYRLDGGVAEPVVVELGPSALGRVVVESGLQEGDVIALEDPTRRPARTEDEPANGGGPTLGPTGGGR